MPKTKKPKKGFNRVYDPIGNAAEAPQDDLETSLQSTLDGKFPVLEKLKSTEVENREWACHSIGSIVVEDAEAAPILIKEEVPLALAQMLCDPDPHVITAAAGALRAASGAPYHRDALCEAIIKSDCFTPMFAIVQRTKVIAEEDPTNKKAKDELLTHIVHTMINLNEISDKAPAIIKFSSAVLPHIFQLLQPHTYSQTLMSAVAQLLNVLSEAQDCIELLAKEKNLITISAVNSYNNPLVRLLSASTILNLAQSDDDVLGVLKLVKPLMVETLTKFDAVTAANQLVALQAQIDQLEAFPHKKDQHLDMDGDAAMAAQPTEGAVEEDLTARAQLDALFAQFDQLTSVWKLNAESQAVALEITANILSGSDPEDFDNEFMEMEEDAQGQGEGAHAINPAVLASLVEGGLIGAAVSKTPIPVYNKQPGVLEEDLEKELERLLFEIQNHALGCVQNLSLVLPAYAQVTQATFATDVASLWQTCVHICQASPSLGNIPETQSAVLLSATTVMMHLLRENVARGHGLLALVPDQLAFVSELAKKYPAEQVRTNAISLMGLFAQHPQLQAFIETFGMQFVESLGDASPWVYAEALNAIFDVFAEPPTNATVTKIGLMAKLNQFLPFLKSQIQEGKRNRANRVLLDRLDETRINLTRFIKYKQQQGV